MTPLEGVGGGKGVRGFPYKHTNVYSARSNTL